MKGYFRTALFAATALVFAGSVFITGCTDVDDRLGLGLVPDDQKLVVEMDTIRGIKTYIAKEDSQPTSHLRRIILGSRKTDFGVSSASGIYQFMPLESASSGARENSYFGEGAKVHAAFLALYINNISGDTEVGQTFYVYPLKETMRYDTLYYANYNPFTDDNQTRMQNVDVSQGPVFSFTMKDETGGRVFKKIWEVMDGDEDLDGDSFAAGDELYNKGRKYLKDIMALDQDVWEDEDKGDGLFHDAFPGFCIVRASDIKDMSEEELGIAPGTDLGIDVDDPKEAAVYDILMADSYYLEDLSYLTMFTHTPKASRSGLLSGKFSRNEGEPQYDTLETRFYFDDQAADYVKLSNLSVAMLKHDYTGSILADQAALNFQDTVVTNPSKTVFYVQSMVGPAGYLYFDAAFKQKLQNIMDRHEGYKSMFINKAWLSVPLKSDVEDADYYLAADAAPERLGLYLNMKGSYPVNVPDYPYLDEAINSYKSSFGGDLNYSKGRYEMDISTYVRQLLVNPDGTRDRIWLSPAWGLSMFSQLNEVVLENDPDGKEIELAITYTLIR